jgi:hypothetical protein
MISIDRTWAIQRYWQNAQSVVTIAEATATFSSTDFPGVTSPHSVKVDISAANITTPSDEAAMIAALEAAMAETFLSAEPFHYEQLRFEFNTANATETTIVGPVTSAMVNAERDRRTDEGFTFNGTVFQSRPADRENIAGAYSSAQTAILIGGAQVGDLRWHGGATDFVWIAADDSLVTMDAQTMLAFGQAALNHKSAHIFAASAIKAMSPIPAGFATHVIWP